MEDSILTKVLETGGNQNFNLFIQEFRSKEVLISSDGLNLYIKDYMDIGIHNDTEEVESLALFYKNLRSVSVISESKRLWKINSNSYIMASLIKLDEEKLALFNININKKYSQYNVFEVIGLIESGFDG